MKKKIIGILVMMLLVTIAVLPNVIGFQKTYIKDEKQENINDISTQKIYENPKSTAAYATVTTNKFIYHKGETVYYTILNQGSTWISLGGPPMGEILKLNFLGLNWQRVYPEFWYMMLRYVDPGTSITEEWDQTDLNGNQVSIGLYRVDAWYSESAPPPGSNILGAQKTTSDYFIILP